MDTLILSQQNPSVITRQEAKARGLKKYFTGKPCNRGHCVERSVATTRCLECSKEHQQKFAENAPRCSIDGCNKPIRSMSLCGAHYWLYKSNGDPLVRQVNEKGTYLKWIEEHKSYSGQECLIWPYSRDAKTGYSQLVTYNDVLLRAHVVMCIVAHGPMPSKGMHVAHSCGKGKSGCSNPNHLRWATAKENAADKEIHGTAIKGSEMHNAILTEEDIPKIRALKGVMTQQAIADIYGVSRGAVKAIFYGLTWKHIP